MTTAPTSRYDLARHELADLLDSEPSYRVDQLWTGLYEQASELDELTNLPKALRAELDQELPLALTPVTEQTSDGGETVKWLWAVASRSMSPVACSPRDILWELPVLPTSTRCQHTSEARQADVR